MENRGPRESAPFRAPRPLPGQNFEKISGQPRAKLSEKSCKNSGRFSEIRDSPVDLFIQCCFLIFYQRAPGLSVENFNTCFYTKSELGHLQPKNRVSPIHWEMIQHNTGYLRYDEHMQEEGDKHGVEKQRQR